MANMLVGKLKVRPRSSGKQWKAPKRHIYKEKYKGFTLQAYTEFRIDAYGKKRIQVQYSAEKTTEGGKYLHTYADTLAKVRRKIDRYEFD